MAILLHAVECPVEPLGLVVYKHCTHAGMQSVNLQLGIALPALHGVLDAVSDDLLFRVQKLCHCYLPRRGCPCRCRASSARRCCAAYHCRWASCCACQAWRSEEHTSELQSHSDLV